MTNLNTSTPHRKQFPLLNRKPIQRFNHGIKFSDFGRSVMDYTSQKVKNFGALAMFDLFNTNK
jgi:hypothetical protein